MRDLGGDLRIALIHHPLDWLADHERSNIREELAASVDVVLRGHLHETDVAQVVSPQGGVVHLAAGAAYQTRQWPNRALYVTADDRSLTVFPIRYEDAPTEVWTLDPSVFPDQPGYTGIIQLAIQETLAGQSEVDERAGATASGSATGTGRFLSNIPSRRGRPFVGRDRELEQIAAGLVDRHSERVPAFPGSAFARTAAPRFPGALPEIWNVPPIRNPNFTGRDNELARLKPALASERLVALTGLGGVGKSQLAAQYAHRHAADYQLVWWVTAGPATVVRDLATLSGRLEPAEEGLANEPAAAEAARRRLERRGGWLLIFDNAADPAVVRPWLPRADTGHVLITSRSAAWGGRGVRVEPLGADDATRLFERRGRADDPAAARALADRLGGLPLALEQAGAYLEATGIALAGYVQLFDARRRELLARSFDPATPTVATTWELAFQQLAERAPPAADLLTVAAFLAPEDIPRALLTNPDALPEPLRSLSDALAFNDALAALGRYSLITPASDAFSMHRLVQAVTRDRLASADRQRWAQTAVDLLEAAFPFNGRDPSTWTPAGRLLPHALRACHHAQCERVAPDATRRLLRDAGMYLRQRAEYPQAQLVLAQALRIAEATYGPDRPEVTRDVNNLGLVLRDLGDLQGARAAFERARRIDEAAYGPDHPHVAIDVNNLGLVLHDLGDLQGARAAFERARRIDELD